MQQSIGPWVGVLDLDGTELSSLRGPARPDQAAARILVRLHRAAIGYVTVRSQPVRTLGVRAREAAELNLAEAIGRHLQVDAAANGTDGAGDWVTQVTCPRRFPADGADGLSVVVCTRNRPQSLRECIGSLQRVTYAPMEIMVVDNAPSGPETRDVVADLAADDPRIRYLCEPCPGLSRARNLGLSQASFGLVAFTDDDAVVDAGWPQAVVAGFAADPRAALITGLVCTRSLDTAPERYFDRRYSWGKKLEPRRYDLTENRDPSGLYPFSAGIFGTGANFAVRRASFGRMGGFDTMLGAGAPTRGGEDLDAFVRVILAGERICYLPSALVWHQHRDDASALASQLYSYGHGFGAYLAKRLTKREMTVGTLGRALVPSVRAAGQMRQASQAGRMRRDGGRLALAEAFGVLAGAACYYRLARRAQDS